MLYQRRVDVSFLHWPYEPAVVRNLLPVGVEVDHARRRRSGRG